MYQAATSSLDQMVAADGTNTIWSVDLRSSLQLQVGRLELSQSKVAAALEQANAIIRRLDEAHGPRSAERIGRASSARILAGDALARMGRGIEAKTYWQTALDQLPPSLASSRSGFKVVQFALLKRLGRPRDAEVVAAELDRQGYRHPTYLREK